MLELPSGLDPRALAALAELERRTLAADGGRLKLEWQALRARRGDRVDDVLWWADERLVGFLGLYAFGGGPIELAGMVDPEVRRCGIGTALVDAAMALCADRGQASALLVVPRSSAGGRAIAARRNAPLDHSEHALVLEGPPRSGQAGRAVRLRRATSADTAAVVALMTGAFGKAPDASSVSPEEDGTRQLVVEVDGAVVGAMRVTCDAGTGGVYGFAVAPECRGRGIGRAALRQACEQLRAEGADRVGLEVAVDNDHALGLYTSLGFEPVTTEDYYALAFPAAPPR